MAGLGLCGRWPPDPDCWLTIFGAPDREDPFESAVWALLGEKPEQRAEDFRDQIDRAASRAEMFRNEGFAVFESEVF
jgi:hypothetical protein